jgi:hypothetical protein
LEKKVSVTKLVNEIIRQAMLGHPVQRVRYRDQVFSLGAPRTDLDKALALAACEEDGQDVGKLAARK